MSINIADNMGYNGKKPLDNRTQYATLALMKAVTDANINEGCLAYCAETDKYYKFLSTNSVDASTGKWREFESGGGGGTSDYSDLTNKPSIEGVTLSGNKTASQLGLAKSSEIPTVPSAYTSNPSMDGTASAGSSTAWARGDHIHPKDTSKYGTDDTAETALADGDYFPFYDTSARGKKKTLWSNIKSVLKTYFDTLYNVKLTFSTGLKNTSNTITTDNMPSADISEVMSPLPNSASKYMNYSTEEQVVGQWIDGATIYQKTIDFGAMPNATEKSVAHNISNFNKLIDVVAVGGSSGRFNPIPAVSANSYKNTTSADWGCYLEVNTTNVRVKTYTDWSATTTYVTIQYTKTS